MPNPDLPKDAPAVAASNLAELRGYAGFATAPDPWQGRISEADARRLKHGYYASVSYVDALVGRLLDRLDELGLAKNTIVVLWGDHGFKLGEMNGWAKMSNYLVDTHSPLIIRAPGVVPAGLRLEQLVELVDVYPTLSELAGLPVPGWLQGTSAVPLLRRPDRPWKRAAFSQFLRRGRWLGADGVETMGYGMRTERFHYVAWMNWATRQIMSASFGSANAAYFVWSAAARTRPWASRTLASSSRPGTCQGSSLTSASKDDCAACRRPSRTCLWPSSHNCRNLICIPGIGDGWRPRPSCYRSGASCRTANS